MYLFNGATWQPATHNFGAPRVQSYTSLDGQTWVNLTSGFVPPPRLYGRCIVDSSSRVYIFGSRENAAETESNDVWQLVYNPTTNTQVWTQQTSAAQWTPRDSPGADSYFSSVLGLEVLTLAGGYNLQQAYGGTNDVWVSINLGVSWALASAAAPWQVRDHGVLVASAAGVLVSTAGGFGEYQANDLWASLDGGVTWGSCNGPALNPNAQAFPARKDTTAFFDNSGYLWISAGLNQYYGAGFTTGVVYQAYNDLYKSSLSFNNVPAVAAACGLTVPACGVGLQCYPPSSNCTCGTGRSTTGLASASLCFIEYSLPGNIDYPWSAATSVQFSYYPTNITTAYGPAVEIVNGTGTRTYTNRFGISTTTPLTVAPVGTALANNLLYLNGPSPVDGNGITWNLGTAIQLPGHGPSVLYNQINVYNQSGIVVESYVSRIDGLGSAFLSNVPGYVNTTIGASNINALAPLYATCQAPISFTNGLRAPTQPTASNGAMRIGYTYTISDGVSYSIQGNLTITASSAFGNNFDLLGNPYQVVVNVVGTRRYTYLPTGTSLVSTVNGLSTASYGYADQRFYPYCPLLLGCTPSTLRPSSIMTGWSSPSLPPHLRMGWRQGWECSTTPPPSTLPHQSPPQS